MNIYLFFLEVIDWAANLVRKEKERVLSFNMYLAVQQRWRRERKKTKCMPLFHVIIHAARIRFLRLFHTCSMVIDLSPVNFTFDAFSYDLRNYSEFYLFDSRKVWYGRVRSCRGLDKIYQQLKITLATVKQVFNLFELSYQKKKIIK